MNGIKTFDDLIAVVEKGTFQDIMSSGSNRISDLMNAATGLFQSFPWDDQMKVMACMVGMIMGTLHGEPTAAGTTLGVIITEEDRLRMFRTQALVVFRESLKSRGITLPSPTGKAPAPQQAKPPAKLFAIASGKRKRRPRKKAL